MHSTTCLVPHSGIFLTCSGAACAARGGPVGSAACRRYPVQHQVSCIVAVAYEGADDAEHKVGPRTANAGDDAVACEAAGDIECGFGPSTNGLRPPGDVALHRKGPERDLLRCLRSIGESRSRKSQ
jgi:hypothetical protein